MNVAVMRNTLVAPRRRPFPATSKVKSLFWTGRGPRPLAPQLQSDWSHFSRGSRALVMETVFDAAPVGHLSRQMVT